MTSPETPKPAPENPQFQLANQLMAHYIGALEIAKEMQETAQLDPLTKLPNRLALEQTYAGLQGSEHHRRANDINHTEQPAPHSILMVDLDNFKKINDTQGHDKGDRVLKKVAGLMAGNIRGGDLAARIGGEEFAVLLPRTKTDQAALVAETLRHLAEEAGDATLSIGVAEMDLSKPLEDNLINADMALYRAKENGRNQVVRYEDLAAKTASHSNGSTG